MEETVQRHNYNALVDQNKHSVSGDKQGCKTKVRAVKMDRCSLVRSGPYRTLQERERARRLVLVENAW